MQEDKVDNLGEVDADKRKGEVGADERGGRSGY